jgi:hypothetical protein
MRLLKSFSTYFLLFLCNVRVYVPGIMAIMMLSLGAFYHTFKTFGTRPLTGAEWAAGIAVAVVSGYADKFFFNLISKAFNG